MVIHLSKGAVVGFVSCDPQVLQYVGMFLAKTVRRTKSGKIRVYYVLRTSYWDKSLKRQRHRYLAYIGTKPVLTIAEARQLAHRLGCTVDDLRRVKRLRITG